MKVTFTKVEVTDPAVVALAKASGRTATEVASAVNGQRYRREYNKLKQQEMKVLRGLLKAHPELLSTPKEGK